MKAETFVEFSGKQISQAELVKEIKKIYTSAGHKASDIKSLNIYIKPEENAAYYVINNEFQGSYIL